MVAEVQPTAPDSAVSGEQPEEPPSAAVEEQAPPADAAVSEQGEDFDEDEQAFLALLNEEKSEDAPAAPDLPGQTHQEALKANQEAWVRSFGQIFQGNENDVVQYLQQEFGMNSGEARNAWHQKLRPLFQQLGQAGGHFFSQNLHAWIDYSLTPTERETFRGTGDKARVYRNEGEIAKGLVATGRQLERADMVKAGWMTKEAADKRALSTYRKKVNGDNIRSGNEVNGLVPSTGSKYYSEMTYEERSKLTPEERNAAVNREASARSRR